MLDLPIKTTALSNFYIKQQQTKKKSKPLCGGIVIITAADSEAGKKECLEAAAFCFFVCFPVKWSWNTAARFFSTAN